MMLLLSNKSSFLCFLAAFHPFVPLTFNVHLGIDIELSNIKII